MAFLTWTRAVETGFEDIDAQHMKLVDYINDFHTTWETKNRVDTKIALQQLIDYTVEHFAYEEQMLEEANYFMLEPHKKVHANFVRKMTDLQGRYENGDDTAAEELINVLDGWLFRHIQLNDHGYVEHVKKAGVR